MVALEATGPFVRRRKVSFCTVFGFILATCRLSSPHKFCLHFSVYLEKSSSPQRRDSASASASAPARCSRGGAGCARARSGRSGGGGLPALPPPMRRSWRQRAAAGRAAPHPPRPRCRCHSRRTLKNQATRY